MFAFSTLNLDMASASLLYLVDLSYSFLSLDQLPTFHSLHFHCKISGSVLSLPLRHLHPFVTLLSSFSVVSCLHEVLLDSYRVLQTVILPTSPWSAVSWSPPMSPVVLHVFLLCCMVGWIIALKVHVLIPRTCDYYLIWQKVSADWVN